MNIDEYEFESFDRSPKSEKETKLKDEIEFHNEIISDSSEDFLLRVVDHPMTIMGLSPEEEIDQLIYGIVVDEAKRRELIKE